MSAYTVASGEYPIFVRVRAPRRRRQRTPGWLSAGGMVVGGAGVGLVAILLGALYWLAHAVDAPAAGRTLLAFATVVMAVIAGGLLAAAWGVRAVNAATETRMDQLRAALAARPDVLEGVAEEIRTVVARQRADIVTALKQGPSRDDLRELGERVEGRFAAVDRRVDEVAETVAQAATAEAVMARVHGGDVRPLRPRGSAR